MNLDLFARLEVRCPVCRGAGRDCRLEVAKTLAELGAGELQEGILICHEPACQREFPVIDGLPLLFADLRAVIAGQGSLLLEREDLSAEMLSLLGDAYGAGSAFDGARQHLSTYAESHWGDFAQPADPAGAASAASFVRLLEKAFEIAPPPPSGPLLDLGCALGRGTAELAGRGVAAVGIDLHLGLLRQAARLRSTGALRYGRRELGLVYHPVLVEPGLPRPGDYDFWAADALDLPFAGASFSAVLAMNLLDCVSSPWDLLREIGRVLRPGGIAWLATPWDWSAGSTPFPAWLGGHSQRGGSGGRSGEILRGLLGGDHPSALPFFEIVGEAPRLPWRLRLHDRSQIEYAADLVVVRRLAESAPE